MVKKLSELLCDLWSKKLNKIEDLERLFKARLIALNKVHPKIPKKSEFRPIIILSLIVKIMESRWLPKLKEYMVYKMCPSQVGFVPGQGVFTNIFRAISVIRERTEKKKSAFGLFIDFKSAYNFARHDLLFKRLENILEKDEITFQKAIYDKIVIRAGKTYFRPNLGVAQGSIISPALFDIYLEPLLKLKEIIPIKDIFAYADDVLVIFDDLETLRKCCKIIESWSNDNNLQINRNKSAILEFVHRRGRETYLKVGDYWMGFPIVDKYKYLGTWLNQKLTMDTQISHIQKKTYFIRSKLSPALYNASLGLRKNLWQIFVVPMYEFLLPLFFHEQVEIRKQKIDQMMRMSFKAYTGLKKTINNSIVEDLMGYNLIKRASILHHISEQKWNYRERNQLYDPQNDQVVNDYRDSKSNNLCKYLPKSMVKYLNMQTSLCPECFKFNIKTRTSLDHLRKVHGIFIQENKLLIEQICNLEERVYSNHSDVNGNKRKSIIETAEILVRDHIAKFQYFLNKSM